MKVTKVIPIFNVEQYIAKCITSVKQQTFKGEVECLLIDDCGTDKSVEIAKKQIKGYSGNIQFRMIHHTINRGQSAARNTGIRESKGDWIYFLDSDDSITPDCIATLFEVASVYPKAQIIQGGAITSTGEPVHIDMERDNGNVIDYMDDVSEIKKDVDFQSVVLFCCCVEQINQERFHPEKPFIFLGGCNL